MGGGVQAGASRDLSLRLRLLLLAIGLVALSLVLSGTLTWFLVRNLEFENAQGELDRSVLVYEPLIERRECITPAPSGSACLPNQRNVTTSAGFTEAMKQFSEGLAGDRLILLDNSSRVLFDSRDQIPPGQPIDEGRITRRIQGQDVQELEFIAGGQRFKGAATRLRSCPFGPNPNRFCRNPVGASIVVLARPYDTIAASASRALIPRLLEAGLVVLAFAIVLARLLSRAFIRPLQELKRAAEDIAAGNYGRRVSEGGPDEIGVVSRAFNRMAQGVERSRQLQRDFLANVSHELKTPLTSLIGFSQALVDGSLRTDQEKARAAHILHEEAVRVLRMSQELLDLARVESGQLAFHLEPVDLAAQLLQETEIVRPRATSRRLELRFAVPSGLPPIEADPERLHQIVDNLLDNAVKYAPEGTAVWVGAEAVGPAVVISVRNQAGAHPPDPGRMFERFYRADPSRSSAAGGVGLGLAISRELALAMAGDLDAELDADGNLILRLRLPALAGVDQVLDVAGRATVRLSPRPLPPPPARP